tara:strand:- start:9066 stop:10580 length:1515 start_codon:yes stop_codon:yes gene_type:complete
MMKAKSPPFHRNLEMHLRDVRQRNMVVVAPRGHAKSSLVAALFVIWHVFFEDRFRWLQGMQTTPRQTTKHVVLISKTASEAIKRLNTIKVMLGHDGEYSSRFRTVMGDWGEDTAKRWTEAEIVLKDGTMIKALGTGQQARGLKKGHLRPTLIVCDDPEDELNTRSENAMADNRRWLLQSVAPSLDISKGRLVVIGTPLNTQCLVVKLQQAKGWRVLWYKNDLRGNRSMWYDSATREWETKENVLWPEYITTTRLAEERATARSLGMLSSYYREWEAVIVGDEDQIFKPEYLIEWVGTLERDLVDNPILVLRSRGAEKFDPPIRVPVAITTGVDPASSIAVAADKTAIVNVAMDAQSRYYVLKEGCLKRLNPDGVVQAIADNHKIVRPWRGVIEVTSAFMYIWQYLRRDHGISYIQDKPTIKKKGDGSRLESLQPIFARGDMFLPEGADEAREQLLGYPRAKDDWIDGLEKAVRFASTPWYSEATQDDMDDSEKSGSRQYDPMLS